MPADGQTALVRAPIQTGAQVMAIIPQSFDDAWRVAGALAASGLTSFKRHEEALAAIMAGAEVGLPPFASLQSFMYVNGRLSMWGDAMLALVQSRGHKVEEWHEGSLEAGDFTAWCKVTRCDTGIIYLESFSIADAQRAGLWQTQETVRRKSKDGGWYDAKNDAPWFRYPKRMMKYRARGFALRDGASDVLRGIKMVEEVQDYPQIEDAALNARLIDRSGDNDQRPAEERDSRIGKFGVIGGQAGKDAFDDLAQRMSEATAEDELDAAWEEAERTPLSKNRMDALADYCEAVRAALRDEMPIPAPPRFNEPPPPSPYAALKAEADTITNAEGFKAWAAKLTIETLGKCSDQERADLKALHAAKKQFPAGVAGKTEGAGHPVHRKEDTSSPGGDVGPASSSPFEALKDQGLAVVAIDAKQKVRRRKAYAEWLEALCIAKPKCSPMEQRELETIEANVAKEIGA